MSSVAIQATDTPDHRSVQQNSPEHTPFITGTWHADNSPLEETLADIADRCPDLMPLARFLLHRLPRALLSSNNLKSETPISRYRSMSRAVRCKWFGTQTRHQDIINTLMVDCDGEDWEAELEAAIVLGLPRPTFVVRKPAKWCPHTALPVGRGHETAHLYWVLKVPVRKSNPKAYDLFTRVRNALVNMLGADPAANGHLGKNPFHRDYITDVGPLEPVELSDLYKPMMALCEEGDYFLGKRSTSRDGSPAYDPFRHATKNDEELSEESMGKWGKLFEARWGIYRAGFAARDYRLVLAMVEEHALKVGSNAKPGDIGDTARSIHRWMVDKYLGNGRRPGIDHGVMSREHIEGLRLEWFGLEKKVKRQLAGQRSAAMRAGKTNEAIRKEVMRALAANEVVSQKSLANAAGVGVRRIQTIWGNALAAPVCDQQSVQDLSLSGAEGASSPSSSSSSYLTLREISRISKERAALARAETEKARKLLGLAKAMRKRGSVPQEIPCLTPGASIAVRNAHREARVAFRDCIRRRDKRNEKLAMKARRQEKLAKFRGWAEAGDIKAYKDFLASETAKWDRIEAVQAHEKRGMKELIRIRRGAAFKRHAADWDAALRYIRGELPEQGHNMKRRAPKTFRTVLDNLDRIAVEAAARGSLSSSQASDGCISAAPRRPSFLKPRTHEHADVDPATV